MSTVAVIPSLLPTLAGDARRAYLMQVLKQADKNSFWPLFLEWYPQLDDAWPVRKALLQLMRNGGDARLFLRPENASLILQQPHEAILIFRGAPTKRRSGLEWTLSKKDADAQARQARAACGSGNVYDAVASRRHILAVLDGPGETPILIVDYLALPDIRRLPPEALRDERAYLRFYISHEIISPDALRARELQPPRTDAASLLDRVIWQPTPMPALARIPTGKLKDNLERARYQLAAAHLEREMLQLRSEIQRMEDVVRWREQNPKGDAAGHWPWEAPKKTPKGKSPGRPKKKAA